MVIKEAAYLRRFEVLDGFILISSSHAPIAVIICGVQALIIMLNLQAKEKRYTLIIAVLSQGQAKQYARRIIFLKKI